MSKVELISLTPDAEKTMAYIARVSNPNNQKNEDYSKLLSYCIKNEHWSVFEQAFMTLQIETNRGIAAQILRHRSFTFQEFSQRYADSSQFRQNSIADLPDELKKRFNQKISLHFKAASELYEDLLAEGIAKECARFVLPLATPTRIYMSGSCRSWIHYIHLRSANGTQEEHKAIAQHCKIIFKQSFPTVSKSLNW